MITPDTLQRVGEALYGASWQSDLARGLDINERTLRRWLGGADIPPGIAEDLARLLAARCAQIVELEEELAAAKPPVAPRRS